jgi:transposase
MLTAWRAKGVRSMPGQLVLRAFTAGERDLLAAKLKEKKLPTKIHERYRLVALVAGGMSANAAGTVVGCTDVKAQHWVHRFNASGFETFEKQPNHPGRPIIIDGQQVRSLIRVALSRPEDLGLPFTQWSVRKLRAHCLKEGLIPPITDEWVRRLLRREGVSYQHTKTWKASPDPEFEVKKTLSSTSTSAAPQVGRSSASTSAARSN